MSHLPLLLLSIILLGIVRLSSASSRIAGGDTGVPKQFPYQVSLRANHEHICGGSIISNRYVLTAAHCITPRPNLIFTAEMLSVRAGSINHIASGIVVPVKRTIVHPLFQKYDDVALLELKEELIFSDAIQPIEIFIGTIPPNSEVIISGWGFTAHDEPSSPIYMQYNTLTALSRIDCAKSIGIYTNTLICIAHQKGTGSCFGDSGGPAAYDGKLAGISSFIKERCGSSVPDAYTNVSFYNDWILSNMV